MNEDIASEIFYFTDYLIIGDKSCQFLCCLHYGKDSMVLWGIANSFINRNLDSTFGIGNTET